MFVRGTLNDETRVIREIYAHLDSRCRGDKGRKKDNKGERLTYGVNVKHSVSCEPSSTELVKCALEIIQNDSITEAFEHET